MPLYVCRNHPLPAGGFPFEADKPVCPQCGLNRDEKPEYASYIAEREVIHFDPPHPVLIDRGTNRAACSGLPIGGGDPRMGGKFLFGTPAREAVTCPACRQTDVFKGDQPSGQALRAVVADAG